MSRFFGGGSDSSSSSSSSESDGEETPFTKGGKPGGAGGGVPAGRSAFAYAFSDDEEDTKRVVKSAKEKRDEQLNAIIKAIRNSKKIKDFNKMETSFQVFMLFVLSLTDL